MASLQTPARAGYHHGNLRAELLEAAVRRIRSGAVGPLVARELARTVGVSSAAVYRHFPDVEHLRAEVARTARQQLAQSMIDLRDDVPRTGRDRALAVARFRATGEGYIRFAAAEPGLFEAAFAHCTAPPSAPDAPSAWEVLTAALDDLVDTGALAPALREQAPIIAWTSVHGLSSLLVHGSAPVGPSVQDSIRVVLDGVDRALGLAPD